VVFHRARWQANIGLFLILLVGFGFGAILLMQSKEIAIPVTPIVPSTSTGALKPGMDMTSNEMKVTPPNNSPVTLLIIFLGSNVALIVSAVILKRVRTKGKVVQS
jgi:hypothetical protein